MQTKQVSLLKVFSILDGRLSTNMDDVYDMMNFIFGDGVTTIELLICMDAIERNKPQWYIDGKLFLYGIEKEVGSNDFDAMINHIKTHYSNTYITLTKI
jgi:hypothetical protein